MGTPLIGLVDDIAPISHLKIKKFCQKQLTNWGLIMNQFMLIFENRIQM